MTKARKFIRNFQKEMDKINPSIKLQCDYQAVLRYFLKHHGEKELYKFMLGITNQVQAMLSHLQYRTTGQKLKSRLLFESITLKKQRQVTYQVTVEAFDGIP
jgi:hypothetical protein